MSFDNWKTNAPDPGTVEDRTYLDDVCNVCWDEDATTFIDRGEDFAYWTGQPRKLPTCVACAEKHDNAEPDDLTCEEKFARVSEAHERMAEIFRQKR